ncbi:MAG: DUF3568 family protein [Verrucomicrobiota bacterium]
MIRPSLVSIAVFILVAVIQTGCSTPSTADSPPGMHYSQGSLLAVEAASMDKVWRASRAALSSLDITELEAQGSTLAAFIDGRTPDLKKVTIKMRPLSPTKTELKIRIGTFGDESLAHLIYEKIQIALAP